MAESNRAESSPVRVDDEKNGRDGSIKVRYKGDFGLKGEFDDEITLKFDDGDEFYVSAGFLKMASPVFTKMLKADFKEKRSRVVDLKGKDPDDFLKLLRYLHPATTKGMMESQVFELVPIAEEYGIQSAICDGKDILKKLLDNAKVPGNQRVSGFSEGSNFKTIGVKRVKLTNDNYYVVIEKQDWESLHTCFKVLIFAANFAYLKIEEMALIQISKYPSAMYTEKSAPNEHADIDCYEQYSNLPDALKNKIVCERLNVIDKKCVTNYE